MVTSDSVSDVLSAWQGLFILTVQSFFFLLRLEGSKWNNSTWPPVPTACFLFFHLQWGSCVKNKKAAKNISLMPDCRNVLSSYHPLTALASASLPRLLSTSLTSLFNGLIRHLPGVTDCWSALAFSACHSPSLPPHWWRSQTSACKRAVCVNCLMPQPSPTFAPSLVIGLSHSLKGPVTLLATENRGKAMGLIKPWVVTGKERG